MTLFRLFWVGAAPPRLPWDTASNLLILCWNSRLWKIWGVRGPQTQLAEVWLEKGYELWDALLLCREGTRRPTVGQNISMVVGKG